MKSKGPPDTIVCGIDEYSLSVGLFAGRKVCIPVFCVVEDPPFTDRYLPPIRWSRRKERRFRQLIVEKLLSQFAGIFYFVESEVLKEFSLPNIPIYQLMNGLSPQALGWVQRQPNSPKNPGKCIIGYVGAIDGKHGIEDLLEIFAAARRRAANLRLRLIGPMVNSYAPYYQAKLGDLGLDSSVEITGWLPYEKMLASLYECDICVSCNRPTEWFKAAQPLKVCEYIALGKPTIAWDYPGTRRLLDHGRYGILVPPGNKPVFAEALASLVEPTAREHIAREVRLAAKRNWTSDYWYSQVLQVLTDTTKRWKGEFGKRL